MKKLLAVLLILGLAAVPAMAAEVTISGSQVVQYTWTSVTSAEDANAATPPTISVVTTAFCHFLKTEKAQVSNSAGRPLIR